MEHLKEKLTPPGINDSSAGSLADFALGGATFLLSSGFVWLIDGRILFAVIAGAIFSTGLFALATWLAARDRRPGASLLKVRLFYWGSVVPVTILSGAQLLLSSKARGPMQAIHALFLCVTLAAGTWHYVTRARSVRGAGGEVV